MDVLSQVLAAMRTGRPRYRRIECHLPWGQLYPPSPGAGFHVVLQGSCHLMPTAGDAIALGVGDVVLLPHGRGHAMADDPGTPPVEVECPPDDEFQPRRTTGPGRTDGTPPSTVLLSGTYPIDQRQCHPVVNDLPEIIHLPAHLGQHPPLRTAIGQISEEIRHPSIGSDGVLSALLETLLLYILRAWYQDHGTGPGWGPALNDPAISTVLCRIHHNPERQWTVEGLGAEAGLSRAAFARRFTALVGQPPLTYLTWSRMGVAAQMLRNSDAPLGTVAQRVGYTSEFAFSNAFKRTHGAAPGAYRRRNRSLQLR
ncbi:AraC family transcriptional regulator [Streptosporangium saharense]|uniref:AraC family transcriptional regulator n=1 Tax=Streptosporangium saharense TaxID=1706840 RepID=UPI00367E2A0A